MRVGFALRSVLWTVLLPGFFAGYVPWRFFEAADLAHGQRRARRPHEVGDGAAEVRLESPLVSLQAAKADLRRDGRTLRVKIKA